MLPRSISSELSLGYTVACCVEDPPSIVLQSKNYVFRVGHIDEMDVGEKSI